MDMPPPVEINQVIPSSMECSPPEEFIKHHILNRIDGPDIPDNVKQFANENNCFDRIKSSYWSYKIFKNEGGVYFCEKKGKTQIIYEKDNNMRFAKWYEKYKFKKIIFEF